jgi:hypothetical protein
VRRRPAYWGGADVPLPPTPVLPEDSPGPSGLTAPDPLFTTAFEFVGFIGAEVDERIRVEPVVAGWRFTAPFLAVLFIVWDEDALLPMPAASGFPPVPVVPTAPDP